MSLDISADRHRKCRLAARGVAFDRVPVVGVDQRPMRDPLGSAAARRCKSPFKLPGKATFLGTIYLVTRGRLCRACSTNQSGWIGIDTDQYGSIRTVRQAVRQTVRQAARQTVRQAALES